MKLSKIIGWFKMTAAKEINILRRMPGNSVWQRSYFERIIRNDKELDKIRDYLSNNVLTWAYESQHENPDNL